MHNNIEMLDVTIGGIQEIHYKYNVLYDCAWYDMVGLPLWFCNSCKPCNNNPLFNRFEVCFQFLASNLFTLIFLLFLLLAMLKSVGILLVDLEHIVKIGLSSIGRSHRSYWFKWFFLRSYCAWYISTYTELLCRNSSSWSIEPWCAYKWDWWGIWSLWQWSVSWVPEPWYGNGDIYCVANQFDKLS